MKSVDYTEGITRTKPSEWNTHKDQQGQSQLSGIHRWTNKDKAKSMEYTEGPTRTKPSQWNTQKDRQGQSQVSGIHRRTKDLGQVSEMGSWTGQQRLSQVWKLQSEGLTRGLFRPVDWMYYHKVQVVSILWCINTEVTAFPLARPNSYKKHISDIRELLFTQSAFTHGTSKTIQWRKKKKSTTRLTINRHNCWRQWGSHLCWNGPVEWGKQF